MSGPYPGDPFDPLDSLVSFFSRGLSVAGYEGHEEERLVSSVRQGT